MSGVVSKFVFESFSSPQEGASVVVSLPRAAAGASLSGSKLACEVIEEERRNVSQSSKQEAPLSTVGDQATRVTEYSDGYPKPKLPASQERLLRGHRAVVRLLSEVQDRQSTRFGDLNEVEIDALETLLGGVSDGSSAGR